MSQSPEKLDEGREENGMNPTQAAEHLRVIRELMERPIRSTTRSGLSGIVAGLLALVGCAATVWIIPGYTGPAAPPVAVGLVWLGVFVVAVTLDLLISWRRTRELGRSFWSRTTRQTALAIAPAFILGGVSTLILAHGNAYYDIPAAWMVFYGLAAWSVGLFSIMEVKLLGVAFMAAGVIYPFMCGGYPHSVSVMGFGPIEPTPCGGLFADPVMALALTFGGFHLLYGVVVWKRHGG